MPDYKTMTPHDAFPTLAADRVEVLEDGCWQWTGPSKQSKRTGTLQPIGRVHKDSETYGRIRSLAARVAGIELTKHTSYWAVCDKELCVHPRCMVHALMDASVLRRIYGLCTEEGECLLWKGYVSADRPPYIRMEAGGTVVSYNVRAYLYYIDYPRRFNNYSLAEVTQLLSGREPHCGNRQCVDPTHIDVEARNDAF